MILIINPQVCDLLSLTLLHERVVRSAECLIAYISECAASILINFLIKRQRSNNKTVRVLLPKINYEQK